MTCSSAEWHASIRKLTFSKYLRYVFYCEISDLQESTSFVKYPSHG